MTDSPVCLQESVAVVTFTATIFILTCQRIVPLWGSRDRENNVDGPIFWSIVSQTYVSLFPNLLRNYLAIQSILVTKSINFKYGIIEILGSFTLIIVTLGFLIADVYIFRPCNWRKKRIHFHDFMLNVHSRLQVRDQTSFYLSRLIWTPWNSYYQERNNFRLVLH